MVRLVDVSREVSSPVPSRRHRHASCGARGGTRRATYIVVVDGAQRDRRCAGHGHKVPGSGCTRRRHRFLCRRTCVSRPAGWAAARLRPGRRFRMMSVACLGRSTGSASTASASPERELEPGEDAVLDRRRCLSRRCSTCSSRARRSRISFDDGNASDVEVALEALRASGDLTASFFVLAGRLGSAGQSRCRGSARARSRGDDGRHARHGSSSMARAFGT